MGFCCTEIKSIKLSTLPNLLGIKLFELCASSKKAPKSFRAVKKQLGNSAEAAQKPRAKRVQ